MTAGRLYRLAAEPGTAVRLPGTAEEHLEVLGAAALPESAAALLPHLRDGGFTAFYYPARASWGADYWRASREAARRGREIVRVYVLQESGQLDDPCFLSMVHADARAGIETLYVLERQLAAHYPRDFALWDGELFVETLLRPAPGGLEARGCRYFQDPKHLADAGELRRRILAVAAPCTGLPSEESLLAESVEEQHRAARQWCRSNGNGGETCAWYHGSWHLLRACGVVVTPAWHGDFFAREIRAGVDAAVARRGKATLLISGLADYGMLYHVLAAVGPRRIEKCEIDLLDLCEVPLRMCRWLQERLRESPTELEVPIRNALSRNLFADPLPAASYDLIVSDAFITRFERIADKRRVVEEWLRLIAPDGRAVTTIKHCSLFDDFPPSAVWRLRFVEKALEKRPGYVPPGELETLAREYARRVHSFPFPDAARVRDFLDEIPGLETATFRVDDERDGGVGTPFVQVVLKRSGDRREP